MDLVHYYMKMYEVRGTFGTLVSAYKAPADLW